MLQLTRDLGLFQKALVNVRPVAKGLVQHLDGQVSVQVMVPAAEHGAHAAMGDLLQKLVPFGQKRYRRGRTPAVLAGVSSTVDSKSQRSCEGVGVS